MAELHFDVPPATIRHGSDGSRERGGQDPQGTRPHEIGPSESQRIGGMGEVVRLAYEFAA
jgi:hypothetical protein